MGRPLPRHLADAYLPVAISEYECRESGLRWFSPANLGGADYYEWLAGSFDWYYSPDTWDKREALQCLVQRGCRRFVEVGSGDGGFLAAAAKRGIQGIGLEINEPALERCRVAGLTAFHPSQLHTTSINADTIVLLQSLEHFSNPVEFLQSLLGSIAVKRIVVAVPCFEALIGHSTHPLLWPPHHATVWSARALHSLATVLRFRLVDLLYDQPTFSMFLHWRSLEPEHAFPDLPNIPANRLGKGMFLFFKHAVRAHWARRFHSVLGVLERT